MQNTIRHAQIKGENKQHKYEKLIEVLFTADRSLLLPGGASAQRAILALKSVTDIVDGDRPAQEEFLENLHRAAQALQVSVVLSHILTSQPRMMCRDAAKRLRLGTLCLGSPVECQSRPIARMQLRRPDNCVLCVQDVNLSRAGICGGQGHQGSLTQPPTLLMCCSEHLPAWSRNCGERQWRLCKCLVDMTQASDMCHASSDTLRHTLIVAERACKCLQTRERQLMS